MSATIDMDRIRRCAGWESARVFLADGSDRVIAASPGRGRAQRTARMIDALDWARVELLAADGSVVDVLARDDAPEPEAQNAPDDPVARQVAVIARETRANTETMRSIMKDALQAHSHAIEILSRLVQQLATTHTEAVEATRAAAYALSPPAPADNEDGEDKQNAQLVSTILQGVLTRALTPGTDSPSDGGSKA